jgi:hypothetical protein
MSQPTVRNHRVRRGIAGLGVLATAAAGLLVGTSGAAAETTEPVDPQLAVYVEVNSNDLANVADYTLAESGEAAIDMAMIFAANINYDGEKAYLHFNERVTETLDDAETQIRPVQEKGTKVLLSVLGNHQGAGFAMPSPRSSPTPSRPMAWTASTSTTSGQSTARTEPRSRTRSRSDGSRRRCVTDSAPTRSSACTPSVRRTRRPTSPCSTRRTCSTTPGTPTTRRTTPPP